MSELRGELHDPGLLFVDDQAIRCSLLPEAFQHIQQELLGVCDDVEVVGVAAIVADAPDDLGVVVHPVGVDDADVLGRLRAYVHALPEHLLAGQQLRIHAAVEHRVDLAGHHGRDLLV